ncbi:hypothetical protein BRO54_3768 [Geobacillus proteiniphilus]|uniref:Uncharacterized protein n=1 Tax=Geobacillus proteiniphilus TaxID=860353 RepID=A0A1Q5SJ78_9BACL|nr:hypothetical protein BRO54_3768 [Geobacillus proteiniphilus]
MVLGGFIRFPLLVSSSAAPGRRFHAGRKQASSGVFFHYTMNEVRNDDV